MHTRMVIRPSKQWVKMQSAQGCTLWLHTRTDHPATWRHTHWRLNSAGGKPERVPKSIIDAQGEEECWMWKGTILCRGLLIWATFCMCIRSWKLTLRL